MWVQTTKSAGQEGKGRIACGAPDELARYRAVATDLTQERGVVKSRRRRKRRRLQATLPEGMLLILLKYCLPPHRSCATLSTYLTRHQLRLDCSTIRLLGLGRRGRGFGCAPSVYACVPLAQTSLSLLQQVLSINAVLVCLLEFVSTQVLHALSHTGT